MEWWKILLIVVSSLIFIISVYFLIGYIGFGFSLRRKNFASKRIARQLITKKNLYKIDFSWWDRHPAKYLEIRSNDNLKLCGHLISAKTKTKKFVILVHGFGAQYKEMQRYAAMFYDFGYNILAVEDRGHGNSEGKFIGMGWADRLDVIRWIDKLISLFGDDIEIVLMGVSMGGATVCMSSGEELPKNVKCIISDCAFTTIMDQFSYVCAKNFYLMKFAVHILRTYMILFHRYDIKEGDAVSQVRKSQIPILFIHGSEDDFVPTKFVYKLYDAAPMGKKDLLIVHGAMHAQSHPANTTMYESKVQSFLEQYIN